jgi:antitoxin PrlF
MAKSTLTSKGQITIPKVVREQLHLEPGDEVHFDIRDDGSVSMQTQKHAVESLFGLLKAKGKSRRPIAIEEMNPATLDERDR